jgi:hypothetical protein
MPQSHRGMGGRPQKPEPIQSAPPQSTPAQKLTHLKPFNARFRNLLSGFQKHRSILYNPFAQFGTFPAAKTQSGIAGKVKPSEFSNPLSQHLAQNDTFQTNIPHHRPPLGATITRAFRSHARRFESLD